MIVAIYYIAACESNFRESIGKFIETFFAFLDVVEFYGVIYALEEAQKLGLTNIWLECDSVLACVAFTARTNVLLMFRNR